ncbi:TadE/TadG family type IV pilus assembly protein [Methylobacterium pseudosasicola]|uniref:Flp pilus assembly protein TadG n=1 Tax=Methylobacterium pseudosasicola TaxID=582667 RepID=A0A1I4HD45_9HYPH|nr:TadE/TadG family type IV pilus assembly protein [Methylobacterium pseudosasicola]SFL39700.1 Flp pilus assembly protein TadG [Methylobacterium pseudosasicola]
MPDLLSAWRTRRDATARPERKGFLQHLARRFSKARSGQVAIIFALMVVPMLYAAGSAVDYGRRNAAKAQLDAAVDAAVLGVITQKTNVMTSDMLASARTQFMADAAKLGGVTITSFVALPLPGVTQVGLTASYTATVRTTLGSMMNVTTMNISGQSGSVRNVAQYIDFYLLLDNSPSMGLAATATDISNMQRVAGGCAFACHLLNSNGTENTNDNYNIAKRNNIKLRIQVLRDSVSNLVDSAKSSMNLTQQFRMEMWTFSDIQTRLIQLTPSLDQVKTASNQIDLAYSYQDQRDSQTAYERAIAKMTTTIPASGNGVTAQTPIRFLFFVTDGVQDTPIDGTMSNQNAGFKINNNRFISAISPSTCQAMKNNNIKIGIIYTQYLPLYNNDFYNANVKPFENNIGPMLKSCATDGLYFPVTTDGDINQAMQQLFSAALASVRITN